MLRADYARIVLLTLALAVETKGFAKTRHL